MNLQDQHKIICQKRRDREKAQRICSILDAAKKVFAAKGYLKATMDEIALEAEVTKPTIYLYFKTKDDLFFTLMLPLIEDVHRQLQKVEERLTSGKISDGADLIGALFRGFYCAYEALPETFRILQLFQQQGLVSELRPEVRSALNDKGRANFVLHRRILSKGMDMGLIKKANIYEVADVIWATLVGIIQLEDAKYSNHKNKRLTENTLRLAEKLIAEAMTLKSKGKKK
ncbi:MAG TPA: TetR/AcrR family transcriptional regulator [Smithellaceae bacterium]|nr:TetR/AcrR family transcriptional regulator [Smithellaceae bacterium]